jgi:ABC-type multidrug transport system fused ATPase/permease subunit
MLLSTMTDDVSTVQDFVSSDTLSILVDLMTIVGMLGLMFWLNWDFTMLVVSWIYAGLYRMAPVAPGAPNDPTASPRIELTGAELAWPVR